MDGRSSRPLKPAEARLAERQRKHPPHYPCNSKGFDRPQSLCGVLYPDLPADLRAYWTLEA
jgi:hypothetical protein